tara:strand:- start:229 stop:405 length:177 start_codon:yes stop_codon:yes gene_type:complete
VVHEKIVLVTPLTVHVDPDVMGSHEFGERLAGKLTALICIEYLGLSIARQGFLPEFKQ